MPDGMMNAQDIGVVIGSVAALITAIGGMAIWRGRTEVKKDEGPSAVARLMEAIAENTRAINGQTEQFRDNNRLFVNCLDEVKEVNRTIHELRLDMRGR